MTRPNGALHTSPGRRPGTASRTPVRSEGTRHNGGHQTPSRLPPVRRSLRTPETRRSCSEGFTLGWYAGPLWGYDLPADAPRLCPLPRRPRAEDLHRVSDIPVWRAPPQGGICIPAQGDALGLRAAHRCVLKERGITVDIRRHRDHRPCGVPSERLKRVARVPRVSPCAGCRAPLGP